VQQRRAAATAEAAERAESALRDAVEKVSLGKTETAAALAAQATAEAERQRALSAAAHAEAAAAAAHLERDAAQTAAAAAEIARAASAAHVVELEAQVAREQRLVQEAVADAETARSAAAMSARGADERAKLQSQVSELRQRTDALSARNRSLQQYVAHLQQDRDMSASARQELEEGAGEATAHIAALQAQVDSLTTANAQVRLLCSAVLFFC
jgi:hypothetical protein